MARPRQASPALGASVLAAVLAAGAPASASDLMPRVYADDAVTVRAGVKGLGSRVAELGSVQELVVAVTYDPDRVSVEAPDAELFTAAWPPRNGPFLRDWSVSESSAGDGRRTLEATYRFQLLGCPDGALTCPGTKTYPVPEFSLDYRLLAEGNPSHTAQFRPWPAKLLVTAGIPLDEDGKLYPFEEYFPTGGYPEPLGGTSSTGAVLGSFGAGIVALLGGLLMWPFGSRKQNASGRGSEKRWQVSWQELDRDAHADESQRYDRLRRCVVWYCTDELGADPYMWVDRSLESAPEDDEEKLIEARRLFLDVLRNEPGQAAQLQERFARLSGIR